jgi:hypothetical protein
MRRARLLATLAALVVGMVALAGVAWAANAIQCPNSTEYPGFCFGTEQNDVMHGTDKVDIFRAGSGKDTLYGRGGNDELAGDLGPDTQYGGHGDDHLERQSSSHAAVAFRSSAGIVRAITCRLCTAAERLRSKRFLRSPL